MSDIPTAVAALRPKNVGASFFRACNLFDPRPDIEAMSLTPGQKLFLYRGAGFPSKPNDTDLIELHIQTVFTRSLLHRQDRYSKNRHALYTSSKTRTAEEEMRHYARTVFYNPALDREAMRFDLVKLDFSGLSARMASLYRRFPWLKTLKAPDETQVFGDSAANVLSCLLVRSVRARGDNGVLFRSADIKGSAILPPLRLIVEKRGTRRIAKRVAP